MSDEYINATTEKNNIKVKRKIFKEVFDDRTEKSLQKIERRGNLDYIIGPISKGKEANLFVGKVKNKFVAVKIYRIETTNFHCRKSYIDNEDLEKISKNPIKRIYAWTEREYFNLKNAYDNKVKVPKPLDQEGNIIIMELIGNKGIPQKTLKYDKLLKKHYELIYNETIKNLNNLIYNAKTVHADLSEYNIIFFKNKIYFIDMGQSVSTKYERAKMFLDRDLKNLIKFFNALGIKKELEEIKLDIKKVKL
jgi:RIO kinase 1